MAHASLDSPIFIWGDGAHDAVELIMVCGGRNEAHLFALTADRDDAAMRADLLALRDLWRDAPDAWNDAVTDAGAETKGRPGAYRWWPRDRISSAQGPISASADQ